MGGTETDRGAAECDTTILGHDGHCEVDVVTCTVTTDGGTDASDTRDDQA